LTPIICKELQRGRVHGGSIKLERLFFYGNNASNTKYYPVFKVKYKQSVAQGKPQKLAIIICVRKVIVILNSIKRDGVKWWLDYAK